MSIISVSSGNVFIHTIMSLQLFSHSHFVFFFFLNQQLGFAGYCLPDTVTFNTLLSVPNCLAAAAG